MRLILPLVALLLIVQPPVKTLKLCNRDGLGIPVQIGTMIQSTEGVYHREYYLVGFTVLANPTRPIVTARPILPVGAPSQQFPLSMFPMLEVRLR